MINIPLPIQDLLCHNAIKKKRTFNIPSENISIPAALHLSASVTVLSAFKFDTPSVITIATFGTPGRSPCISLNTAVRMRNRASAVFVLPVWREMARMAAVVSSSVRKSSRLNCMVTRELYVRRATRTRSSPWLPMSLSNWTINSRINRKSSSPTLLLVSMRKARSTLTWQSAKSFAKHMQ